MNKVSIRFFATLALLAPAGYFSGRFLAPSGDHSPSQTPGTVDTSRSGVRGGGFSTNLKPKELPDDIQRTENAAVKSSFCDPWATGESIFLPLAFFDAFDYPFVSHERKLNEPFLAHLGIAPDNIPAVQRAFSELNARFDSADLKNRRILRNDAGATGVEIAVYADEAKAIRDNFKAEVASAAGRDKAALLDIMLRKQSGMGEDRGINRRVFELVPSDDGSVAITVKIDNNRSWSYSTTGDLPPNLKHLFEIKTGNPK